MATSAEGIREGKRAGIYARLSEDRHGDELGVKRQLSDCRDLALRQGFSIAGEYVDNDVSAFNGKTRPQYQRLLEDVRGGRIDAIVAWHPDRLYRHPRDLEAFVETVETAGATVATVSAGDLDLSTPSGRMVARMLGAAARFEGEHKAARSARKHRELAEAGKPTGGGTRPFGFEDDRVTIRPSEAAEIEQAARRVLAGGSLRGIAEDWNARGITTPHGGPWRITSLRRMLKSPRIAGLRELRGEVVAEATWDAIITPGDHEQLVAILGDPGRRTTTTTGRVYLGTGSFIVCGKCGAAMVAQPNRPGVRRYACRKDTGGCGGTYHVAETLETFIREAVVDALDGPGLARLQVAMAAVGSGDQEAALTLELSGVHGRIEELASAFAEGTLDLNAFRAATRRLEARRDDIHDRLARTAPSRIVADLPHGADALRAWWDQADLGQRQELAASVIERVIVGPAVVGRNTFDPDRIDVKWRV